MAYETKDHTVYVERQSPAADRGGNSALAFIVGGLLVAVAVLALLFFGGAFDGGGAGNSAPTTSVTIENTDSAPVAPAADPDAVPPQADAVPLPDAAAGGEAAAGDGN